jgi:thiamine pyrophosphate-dependent acetolactate synthase large subunit-like protein
MNDDSGKITGAEGLDRPANLGNPQMKWGSDVVAQALANLDIPYIALVPGASYRGFHDSIVNYLGNRAPQMVVCLHEEHCVAIANGYAKVTETPLAVALHSNVGLMHATMTIFNAWCERSPMVIFGATGPVDAHLRRPWVDWLHTSKDQAAIIRDYIKWDDQPASPESAVESVYRANQIARTHPLGPVYVCLDAALQEAELTRDVAVPAFARYAPPTPPVPDDATVDAVFAALATAKAPLVLFGRVSRDQADWDARVRLAECIGAPVWSIMHNPAAFPTEHPLHFLPMAGEFLSDDEKAYVARADLILSFDWMDLAGFLRNTTGRVQTQTPTDATVIHCSVDGVLANGWSLDHQALPALDINILARPETLVARMLERLPAGVGPDNPIVNAAANADLSHWTAQGRDAEPETGGALSLQAIADAFGDFAKGKDITLSRTPIGWPGNGMHMAGPLDYLGKDGGLAVGTGPGHTIGAALALKESDRMVVGILGDGDYLMGINALWTASRMRLPMMIVVANNRSYFNDEKHQERVAVARERPVENKWIGQQLDDPPADLIALAVAQGFEGEGPVTSAADFAQALARGEAAVRAGGRYVIDVRSTGY